MINKNNINNIDIKVNNSVGTNNNIMAKKGMSVSVSENLLKEFRKHCSDKCINRSALFEKWIKKYLEGEGGI